jgi:hypothetical protein
MRGDCKWPDRQSSVQMLDPSPCREETVLFYLAWAPTEKLFLVN